MIKPHQYEYLLKAYQIGATAFVIVHLSQYEEFYLLPID
jgi:penicillin-binding protein-related factor A (putative recombinase)